MDNQNFDAFLLVGFGGPEKREDVIPFLENVLRGRNVPHERLLEVAEHYYHFDGVSPINAHCRELLAAVTADFAAHGVTLPLYWGNRNWAPYLPDAVTEIKAAGGKRILAFPTSAFSSYSGCRQYRENLADAAGAVGDVEIVTIRRFFNHPGFIEVMIESAQKALAELPGAKILFTAHSIPTSMADTCSYGIQLQEACRLVAEGAGASAWELVYQSRSGPPTQPWLEPDILDALRTEKANGTAAVVVQPIGFISDHMEVMYDLDYEAKHLADGLGLPFLRAGTAGTHPRFVKMVRELVMEYINGAPPIAIGQLPPRPMVCPVDCCPRPAGRPGVR
jgi:protoporphyrin/coproporphyrin ferrochelatase